MMPPRKDKEAAQANKSIPSSPGMASWGRNPFPVRGGGGGRVRSERFLSAMALPVGESSPFQPSLLGSSPKVNAISPTAALTKFEGAAREEDLISPVDEVVVAAAVASAKEVRPRPPPATPVKEVIEDQDLLAASPQATTEPVESSQ
jgi:hypothetical protein